MPHKARDVSHNYKTIRCRYFDDNGLPLQPSCTLGSRCNFIHPSDSRWRKGKKPNPPLHSYPRASTSVSASEPSIKRYQSPLLPQHDLFLSCNPNATDDSHENLQQKRHVLCEVSERIPAHRTYEDHGTTGTQPPESKGGSQRSVKVEDSEYMQPQKVVGTDRHPRPASTVPHTREATFAIISQRDRKQKADKISQLLRAFAKLSSEVAQNTFNCDQEERKLRKYSEITSQLSAISPSVTSAVTETLSDIISKHAHFKQLVEKNIKKQTEVWEELQNLFMQSTTDVFDHILEDLKTKGQRICEVLLSQTTTSLKRKVSETTQPSLSVRIPSDSERERKRKIEAGPPRGPRENRDNSRERKRKKTSEGATKVDELSAIKQQMVELKAENNKLKSTIADMSVAPVATQLPSPTDTSTSMLASPIAESSSDVTIITVDDTTTEPQAPKWPSFSTIQMDFLRRLLDEHVPTQPHAR